MSSPIAENSTKDHSASHSAIVRAIIVDDHPAVCEGLDHSISAQPDMMVCGQASDVETALQLIEELAPDVIVVDIVLKGSDGLDLLSKLKARGSNTRALVHSMYEVSLYAERCLRAGAKGYVNKQASPDEVVRAIRTIMSGQIYLDPSEVSRFLNRAAEAGSRQADPVDSLSNRQLEVFRLIGNGNTTSQIAAQLRISIHTVESHRESIKKKLSVSSIPELTRQAVLWCTNNPPRCTNQPGAPS